MTQVDLATAMKMERSAVSRIETGTRSIDALELARLARVLRRPIGWFLGDPMPSIVSRRAARENLVRKEDVELESLAMDVEQLIELGVLDPPTIDTPRVDSISAAEPAALEARRRAGLADHEPVRELLRVVERLGMYTFVLPLSARDVANVDGSYLMLERGGVALIAGDSESGRKRFTIAHELGHHILADQYSMEWVVSADSTEREKIISAFAIHFLLPRLAVAERWDRLRGHADPRDATIRLATEFSLSWSAVCAQLYRLAYLTRAQYDLLLPQTPTSVDFIERELVIHNDVQAPAVPPGYAAAVIRALKKGKIGPTRALELLHGTIREIDLPAEKSLPLEAMVADLEPLP